MSGLNIDSVHNNSFGVLWDIVIVCTHTYMYLCYPGFVVERSHSNPTYYCFRREILPHKNQKTNENKHCPPFLRMRTNNLQEEMRKPYHSMNNH